MANRLSVDITRLAWQVNVVDDMTVLDAIKKKSSFEEIVNKPLIILTCIFQLYLKQ